MALTRDTCSSDDIPGQCHGYLPRIPWQVGNVLESLTPAAPTVERFIAVLKSQKEPKQQSNGDAALFGDLFDDADINAQPKGTVKVDMGSINLALQFENVRTTRGAYYSSFR